MPVQLRRWLLYFVAVYCFFKALAISLFYTDFFPLLELDYQSDAGKIELISVYAGFFAGLGLFLLWSGQKVQRQTSAFLMLALGSGGTLICRVLLHLVWDSGGIASLLQLGGELLLCGSSFWAWKTAKAPS